MSDRTAWRNRDEDETLTELPGGWALLRAFERTQITLTRLQKGETVFWHITPLPDLLMRILAYLGLSASLYTRLVENST